jgi:hypothetical protein
MVSWRKVAALLAFLNSTIASAQSAFEDQFDSGIVETEKWCACQIDNLNEPVTFPFDAEDSKKRYAQIVVNDYALGGNECLQKAPHFECGPSKILDARAEPEPPELPESLGPSFFGPFAAEPTFAPLTTPRVFTPAVSTKNPYCTDDVELRAHRRHEEDECIQRQELRLLAKQSSAISRRYAFSIRLPESDKLPDKANSIRWVVAQWKAEPLDEKYETEFGPKWGPSPFLAVRFDDGVLHVTVQDENCRCLVASAPTGKVRGTGVFSPQNPEGCLWADGLPHENPYCEPGFTVDYDAEPILTSPQGRWVELRFDVQSGPDATIKVWDGDRLVVTVKGKIGYAQTADTRTKFKIGHYRDYMPFPATLDVDWMTFSD